MKPDGHDVDKLRQMFLRHEAEALPSPVAAETVLRRVRRRRAAVSAAAAALAVLVLSATVGIAKIDWARHDRVPGSHEAPVAPGPLRMLLAGDINIQAPQGWYVLRYPPVLGGGRGGAGGVQLTNFDPKNTLRPVCSSSGDVLPADGVALFVVTQTRTADETLPPEWPVPLAPGGQGQCDGTSMMATWSSSVSQLDYTGYLRVGVAADEQAKAAARDAFASLSFIPVEQALMLDSAGPGSAGPVAVLASGTAGAHPWSLVASVTDYDHLTFDLLGGDNGMGNIHGSSPSDVTAFDAVVGGTTILVGAVDASASDVLVRTDGGNAVPATIVSLPESFGGGLQAFVASLDGAPRGEVYVSDAAGNELGRQLFYPQSASWPGNTLVGDPTPIGDGDTIVSLIGTDGGRLVRQGQGVALLAADGTHVAFAGPPVDGQLSYAEGVVGTGSKPLTEYFGVASPQVTAVRFLYPGGGPTDVLMRRLPDGSSVYFSGIADGSAPPSFRGSIVAIDAGCNVIGSLTPRTGKPDPQARFAACDAG